MVGTDPHRKPDSPPENKQQYRQNDKKYCAALIIGAPELCSDASTTKWGKKAESIVHVYHATIILLMPIVLKSTGKKTYTLHSANTEK